MAAVKMQLGESLSSQFRNLEGRHPSQWPIVPRVLCGIGVLAAVLALGWYFYWSDQLATLEQEQLTEQQLRDSFTAKMRQAVNLDALREQRQQVLDQVATLEKQLPSKAEMDALLSDINQAGIGRGLQFELFKPGNATVKEYYAELPITIRVTGSYHDVGQFASDIARLPRIVTLNNMNLVAQNGNTTLTLDTIAKTFRYLDEEEIASQQAAKTDKRGRR
jgi:type IV pilus assembly protein PilO